MACFFLSGLSALVLEVVWSRAFSLILGSALEGVAIVAAVLLLGLGVGGAVGGRFADRVDRPLLFYGLAELGIGAWATLGLFVLPEAPVLIAATSGSSESEWLRRGLELAVAALFLVPPAILMGITLPLLASGAHRSRDFVSGLGTLYGINTVGAAAGALVSAFVLLPRLGASATTLVAAAVGLVVLMVVHREDAWVAAGTTTFEPKPVPGVYAPWFLGPTFLATGAVALVSEIAWTRSLGLILGSSTYSFSLVVAILLLGIAAGGLIWRVGSRFSPDPPVAYGVLLVLLATAIGVSLLTLDRAGDVFLYLYPRLAESRGRILLSFAGPAAAALLAPAVVLGLHFPLTGEILRYGGRPSGGATGRALLWNACGAVVGSLAAGFVLLPAWGTALTLRAAAALALGLGVFWLISRFELGVYRKLLVAAVTLVLAAAFVAKGPGLKRLFRSQGVYRVVSPAFARESGPRFREFVAKRLAERRYLFESEGRLSSVAVWHAAGNLVLAIGGKPDASYEDMETQVLLGHLPMLFAPRPRSGLVIGHGSGVTARALLTHDLLALQVVEIEAAVLEGARYFEHLSGRLTERDGVEVRTGDGRRLLTYGERAYDVIVSEPSNPWIASNNSLFTTEFYLRARERLAPEGVFVQWFPAYDVSTETICVLLRTLQSVFPDFFLVTSGADLIAVAGRDRLPRWSAAAWERTPDDARRELERIGIRRPEDLIVRILADSTLTLPSGPLNTDNNGWVEFKSPWELSIFGPIRGRTSAQRETLVGPSLPPLAVWRRLGFPVDDESLGRLVDAALVRDDAALASAILGEWTGLVSEDTRSAVADANSRTARKGEVERLFAEAAQHLSRNETDLAVQKLEACYEIDPSNRLISGPLSFFLISRGRLDDARAILERQLRRGAGVERVVVLLNLALIEEREGKAEAAEAFAREALAADPYRGEAYVFLSKLLSREGREDEATELLLEGKRLNPDLDSLRGEGGGGR